MEGPVRSTDPGACLPTRPLSVVDEDGSLPIIACVSTQLLKKLLRDGKLMSSNGRCAKLLLLKAPTVIRPTSPSSIGSNLSEAPIILSSSRSRRSRILVCSSTWVGTEGWAINENGVIDAGVQSADDPWCRP
jgi:hypothetical protein